jgi:hypothetical protein
MRKYRNRQSVLIESLLLCGILSYKEHRWWEIGDVIMPGFPAPGHRAKYTLAWRSTR